MNKRIILCIVLGILAICLGAFFVFQKPIFFGPLGVFNSDNSGGIQRTEEPSPTVSTTKSKPSAGSSSTSSDATPPAPSDSLTGVPSTATLKELAVARGIRIGGNYDSVLRSETHDKIFEQEYNAITAGIFWGDGSRPSRTEYDFSDMDAKVNWGLARGMDIHGHILVWFSPSELPDWVKAA
ncbi:endo-1,4-beta-xylanase, partial [Candidatus Berkelbacteria bacterium]|nr:endo-1,4-beta-xylanase [Candidatus Berkelbacteria bacterium]